MAKPLEEAARALKNLFSSKGSSKSKDSSSKEGSSKRQQKGSKDGEDDGCVSPPACLFGRPGGPPLNLPSVKSSLAVVDAGVLASHSGPDGGIEVLRSCAPDLLLPWDKPTDWAYGSSISMYDATLTAGKFTRSGDPIADCFAIVAYTSGALLVVADGVSWGEPARRAARCAVLGSTQHLHKMLQGLHGTTPGPSSSFVFREMYSSIQAAQALILQQYGTLTTLTLTLVLKLKSSGDKRWAALTLTVGDSPAYVYREKLGSVQELTYGAHEGATRNPEHAPGCLGYAIGEEPDLGNMTASITWLQEGDIVFLVSDGVSDNFDPGSLKLAQAAVPNYQTTNSGRRTSLDERLAGMLCGGPGAEPPAAAPAQPPAASGELPVLEPSAMHAMAMDLLKEAIHEVAAQPSISDVSSGLVLDRYAVTLESDNEASQTPSTSRSGPGVFMGVAGAAATGGAGSRSLGFGGEWEAVPLGSGRQRKGGGGQQEGPTSTSGREAMVAGAGGGAGDGASGNSWKPSMDVGPGLRRSQRGVETSGESWSKAAGSCGVGVGSAAAAGAAGAGAGGGGIGWGAVGGVSGRSGPMSGHGSKAGSSKRASSSSVGVDGGGGQPHQHLHQQQHGLSSRALVDGLLQHVYRVTEPQRLAVAAKAAASLPRHSGPGNSNNSGLLPCIGSSTAGTCAKQVELTKSTMPPGKMDHATAVAYKVGGK